VNEFERLLNALREQDVRFIIIGGVAATLHGSARLTNDLDVVYERSPQNLARIVDALGVFKPYLRGAPPGLPFRFDVETIRRGLNFTFTTTDGDLDLLGEITGVGGYASVLEHTVEATLFGSRYRFIDLDTLIHAKRAAGRAKDLEVVAELEAIRDERTHGRREEEP
jgi:predicted nucleotidyltransferase